MARYTRYSGELNIWADALVQDLEREAGAYAPVRLLSVATVTGLSAAEDNIMLWDESRGVPVISKGGQWFSFSLTAI